MTDELTPVHCGCGGEAKVVKHEYYMCSPTYGVTCYKCGTATNQGFATEAEAVQAWNRAMSGADHFREVTKMVERKKGEWEVQPSTGEDRPSIWWKCSECGHVIFSETEHDRKEFHAFCSRCGADMRGDR